MAKTVGELQMKLGLNTTGAGKVVDMLQDALGGGHISPELAEKLAKLVSEELIAVEVAPDSNVERNRKLLLDRSVLGVQKYGTNTERKDLAISDWAQHAIEEALDFANYLQALKSNLKQFEGIESLVPMEHLESCKEPGCYTYYVNFEVSGEEGRASIVSDGVDRSRAVRLDPHATADDEIVVLATALDIVDCCPELSVEQDAWLTRRLKESARLGK